MEIILAIGNESPYFPPQIPSRLCYGKDYPYSRMNDVVNLMKTEGIRNKYRLSKITDDMLKKIPEDKIYSLTSSSDFLYVKKPGENISRVYKIQNISITQPWTITLSKDGGERIDFIKKDDPHYVIADSELNYYKVREV